MKKANSFRFIRNDNGSGKTATGGIKVGKTSTLNEHFWSRFYVDDFMTIELLLLKSLYF